MSTIKRRTLSRVTPLPASTPAPLHSTHPLAKCIISRHTYIQVGARKENSKMARLKRHLEKVGFKGLGESRESGSSRQKPSSKPGSTSNGGPGDDDELSRLGVGLASKSIGGRVTADGDVAAILSPTSRSHHANRANGVPVEGVGGNGGEGAGSGAESSRLAALSPKRIRSSISISGRKLSAWTLGRAGTEGTRTAGMSQCMRTLD